MACRRPGGCSGLGRILGTTALNGKVSHDNKSQPHSLNSEIFRQHGDNVNLEDFLSVLLHTDVRVVMSTRFDEHPQECFGNGCFITHSWRQTANRRTRPIWTTKHTTPIRQTHTAAYQRRSHSHLQSNVYIHFNCSVLSFVLRVQTESNLTHLMWNSVDCNMKLMNSTHHHRRTAVRPVLTATSQSNGNGQTSTLHRIQTP